MEWGKLVSPCLSCVLFFWQRACERACGLVIYLSAQHQSALFFQQYRLILLSLSPFSCLSPPAVCSYYTYLTAFNQRIFTLNLTNLLSFYLIFRAARISFTPFSFPFSFPISLCNLLLPLLSLYWNFIVKFCWRKLNFNYATLASSRLNENIPLAFALIGACCASFALCTCVFVCVWPMTTFMADRDINFHLFTPNTSAHTQRETHRQT